MSFEETVAMVFQPGMFEVFCLALSMVVMVLVSCLLAGAVGELIVALVRRFIWPGNKSQEERMPTDER